MKANAAVIVFVFLPLTVMCGRGTTEDMGAGMKSASEDARCFYSLESALQFRQTSVIPVGAVKLNKWASVRVLSITSGVAVGIVNSGELLGKTCYIDPLDLK